MNHLTNIELDAALDHATAIDPTATAPETLALLAERERRIADAIARSAAEEAAFWAPVAAPTPPRERSRETTTGWAIRTVRCPHCRRGPGSPCVTADRQIVAGGRRAHPERITAARRANLP